MTKQLLCLEDVWTADGWHKYACNRPAKALARASATAEPFPVCGIHARALERRGYVIHRMADDSHSSNTGKRS